MKKHAKTFVIDTNVLIHRPDAFLSFKEALVVIPLWVFEELDNLKRDHAGRGRSARQAIRYINDYSKKGDLQAGVKLPSGGTLMVGLAQNARIPGNFSMEKMDNKIILCALSYLHTGNQVFFVSKDINARIKAAVLGLKAVDYENNKVSMEYLYEGVIDRSISEDKLTAFQKFGEMEWDDCKLMPNQYVLLRQ
ncbi:MAG: PhoH family protein, partial [Spirochaetaceae bacterium]|nr:PhoH family protein [Spirochaetaceae bacterium]